MFAIAAINDTDSRSQWEPLAPTKEAQEFHLSQMYQDGLLRLHAKDYEKARELLEAVLKDPLVSNAQVETSASDGHLLQLRFLALKNLATVFLEQGSDYYQSALHCYLQAVEIDSKDSVVWNQLGTLACSMGLLSISRWAFEQGLSCSPNNWNCMEKLLEILIAIGDEVACLSVAELILRHWPSHSRALHVKSTIEETEHMPFAPKGIDKLEPKHIRLRFPEKRKVRNEDVDEAVASKKLKQNLEVHLPEASWIALVSELLEILHSLTACGSESGKKVGSGDVRINIQLTHTKGNVGSTERKGLSSMSVNNRNSENDSAAKEKEGSMFDEQPQERRSSRLERLRSRKPGKEDSDGPTNKDPAAVIKQFLGPYLVTGTETEDCRNSTEFIANSIESECTDVIKFIELTSKNCGAYHLAHLLLEEISSRNVTCVSHPEAVAKILELEKLTRQWGQERAPECSLFLAELYHDSGICSSGMCTTSDAMAESSYHLCKIIESVALNYPFDVVSMDQKEKGSLRDGSEQNQVSADSTLMLRNNFPFWIRFFWLSGHLSLWEGDKVKAQDEFFVALALLNNEKTNNPLDSIYLPHCKAAKKLTANRVLQEINLIEVDYLLKTTVNEMLEKSMLSECVNMLAPLLFSANDIHLDLSYGSGQECTGFTSVELSALDVLIKACEQSEAMDIDVYLKSHRRKLQILVAAAGLEASSPNATSGSRALCLLETQSKESLDKRWHSFVVEEVKAISRCALRVKGIANPGEHSNGISLSVIGEIQSLLLALMCSIANAHFSGKSSALGIPDLMEQTETCYFVDAAIAFFKLQQVNLNMRIKTQTELVVSIHDMLAEFGICCARADGESEEGTFLKLAIKHLLALDMKLKSNPHSLSKGLEMKCDQQASHDETNKMGQIDRNVEDTVEMSNAEGIASCKAQEIEITQVERDSSAGGPGVMLSKREVESNPIIQSANELTEDERDELELDIDKALDQCFYCLYGLNIRSDSTYEEDLATHKNTSRGDYQTKEQCADVFQYILPYAKASSRTGLVKLRRVLRAIRKHFPHPPDNILLGNTIDKFLDNPDLSEDQLSEEAGSDGFRSSILKLIFSEPQGLDDRKAALLESSEPYLDVYCNLYYLLAQSEEMNATDKWAGFVLTKEGEEFVEQNAKLLKYDLIYNPLRFESWQRLANIYDEEVDLLLNDGSKQINVLAWRKNATLPQRVDASRRRSRRCFLMTLALAKTAIEQGEIHELLALVYYDAIQNVVPFYDQRLVVPSKDDPWKVFCHNSMNHFKKASEHKEDWSHSFYLGKLSEKLGYSHDTSFSYYAKAITVNPSAVDPFYRLHASRLKLLCSCGKQDGDALKVIASYSFTQSTKETVMSLFAGHGSESLEGLVHAEDGVSNSNSEEFSRKLEEAWDLLYNDCLVALETCIEGDLKHFHKARYMLAQGFYRRGGTGDLDKAKEELSFCFKSSRSSFTINMWEIDSMVKKGRRKTPGPSGNKKVLEVNLAESSRKYITCIRKYFLFYLKLLEETGDISILERAHVSLRADKRFSLCLEDLVPVAIGRYIRALIFSTKQAIIGSDAAGDSAEHVLEKIFSLFLEQVNLWSDICSLPDLRSEELTESSLYRYLCQYIQLLERNVKVETLEGINEKIRKRLKNPKLSNSICAKVYRHVSAAWCRSLVINMALITPLHSTISSEIQVQNLLGGFLENEQLLCVDLQSEELWSSAFEDPSHLKSLEIKWNALLSKIKNIIIKRVSDEDMETASILLRSSYSFYKDTSCALLPSGINLYMVPSQLATETYIQPGIDGVDILDMNTSRKLLLWAYSLMHGHCPNVSSVIKYCEENAKSKMKRGTASSSTPPSASASTPAASQAGGGKDGISRSSDSEIHPLPTAETASMPETDNGRVLASATQPEADSNQNLASASLPETEGNGDRVSSSPAPETGGEISGLAPPCGSTSWSSETSSINRQKILSATPNLHPCNNPMVDKNTLDLNAEPDKS